MAVHVIFMSPRGIGSEDAPGIGVIRAREEVAAGGVSEGAAQLGEVVMVVNDTASTVLVAYGSTPDAAAVAQTNATSAGFPVIGGRYSPPFVVPAGAKVGVKAAA